MTRNPAGALWVRLMLVFAVLFLFAQGSLMADNQTSTMLDGMIEALDSSAPLGESNPRPDQISKTLLNRKAVTITNPDGTTETFEFFTPVITPDQPDITPQPEQSQQPGSGWQSKKKGDLHLSDD